MKTASVVCSASYLKGKGWGAEIDSADIVVRVNNNISLIEKHNIDIGNRTDVIYLCGKAWRNKETMNIPNGIEVVKANTDITGVKDKKKRYSANTGVLCVIDYAMQGYKVKVYGMDFYASINNGIIPSSKLSRENPYKVKTEQIYLEWYHGKNTNGKTILTHVGGIKDLELLLHYKSKYDINFDSHTEQVIKNNLKQKDYE